MFFNIEEQNVILDGFFMESIKIVKNSENKNKFANISTSFDKLIIYVNIFLSIFFYKYYVGIWIL